MKSQSSINVIAKTSRKNIHFERDKNSQVFIYWPNLVFDYLLFKRKYEKQWK